MSTIRDRHYTAQAAVTVLEAAANRTRQMIRLKKLSWDSRRNVARSLSWILNIYSQWMYLRRLSGTARQTVHELVQKYDEAVVLPGWYCLQRSTHGRVRDLDAAEALSFGMPTPEEHQLVHALVKRWRALIRQLDIDYSQSRDLMDTLPDYLSIKKLMPIGGRLAYSIIMACKTGQSSRNLPDQHRLFGWTYDNELTEHAIHRAISEIIERMPERSGLAPSVTRGRNYIRSYINWSTKSTEETPAFGGEYPVRVRRVHNLPRIAAYPNMAKEFLTVCYLHLLPPTLIKRALLMTEQERRKCGIWNRMIAKIRGQESLRNDVPTLLTGPPEHVAGDDYVAPCLYALSNRTVTGYVLMRRGWNDVYHATARDARTDATILGLDVGWVRGTLDRATEWYFRYKLEEAERKRTAQQRTADMLRKLRALPLLTRQDSYAAGNCTPGTEQFIQQLELLSTNKDRTYISGRELARCWRKKNYVQMDRLRSVIQYLYKRLEDQQKQEDERLQQKLEQRWDDESPAVVGSVPDTQEAETVAMRAAG